MYAYKPFLSKEVIITPLILNKQFSYSGGDFTADLGDDIAWVDLYYGKNLTTQELYDNLINVNTGLLETYRVGEVYKSVLNTYKNHKANNSFQYFIYPEEYLEDLSVISVSPQLYGEKIFPSSFRLIYNLTTIITDDGEGNLYNGDEYVGNIFYPLGLATFVSGSLTNLCENPDLENLIIDFSSTITIKEHQYKCVVGINEFKGSLNPTLIEGEHDDYKDFVHEQYFSPYVTTVGLYDDNKELLAVAKLSKPLATSRDIDTTIIIKFDE